METTKPTVIYRGARDDERTYVTTISEDGTEAPLDHATGLFNHSPTGLEWGYLGSGPAQLALAILYHHTGNRTFALTYHQQYKQEVISRLPVEGWTLTSEEVSDWITASTPAEV